VNWKQYLSGQEKYGNDGMFFVFDYKNARIVVLDSYSPFVTGAQRNMLLDAIQDNPRTWLFVVWHHPLFDFGPKQYEDYLHEQWGVPLYESGCDIIFNGHAHYYLRTKKLALNGEPHPPLDTEKGTAQIVVGNGGAPLYTIIPDHDGNNYMYAFGMVDYGYCEVRIDGEILYLKHLRASDGTVVDSIVYKTNPKPGASSSN
jgi:hypothetical protein